MSNENNQTLLSIGVFILIIVLAIALYATGIIDWTLIIPLVLIFSGILAFVLGVIRMNKPVKYARSGFSTAAIGLILIAIGGAWYLSGINWLYSIIVILLVIAVLAIVAALKRK